MREIRTSGLMSGEGKRGWLRLATAPFLDSTKTQVPDIHPIYLCRIYVQNVGMIYGYARVSTNGQSVEAPRCCTDRPGGRPGVGWGGGEPSIVEGRLPCRSKPIGSAGTAFPSSGTGSSTGRCTMRAYARAGQPDRMVHDGGNRSVES